MLTTSMNLSASSQWFSRSERKANTSSGDAGTIASAAIGLKKYRGGFAATLES